MCSTLLVCSHSYLYSTFSVVCSSSFSAHVLEFPTLCHIFSHSIIELVFVRSHAFMLTGAALYLCSHYHLDPTVSVVCSSLFSAHFLEFPSHPSIGWRSFGSHMPSCFRCCPWGAACSATECDACQALKLLP